MKNSFKKTIVFLDFDHINNPLLGAGQAHATSQVASRLAKKGYQIQVLCSRYPGSKDGMYKGISYRHIGFGSTNIQLNNLAYFIAAPMALRKVQADLIVECFTAPVSTLFSPFVTKTPVVVLPSMFNAEEFSKKYKIPFHLIEKFALPQYKYMMPYSDVDQAKAKRLNPNIITRIIPQGVSEEYFKIQPGTPKHILFLSRFDIAQKGIDLLLESYALIKDQIKYPLIIAGHGPDESKIKKMIDKLNLAQHVKIVGSAYGKKKEKLMAEALFVAFPSRHDEMCLWTLEALAAGLPIVGFNIPESKWLNKKVSLKAKPFDTKKYARLLLKAADSKTISPMRKDSRQFARNFSWDTVADQFSDFFEFVLKKEMAQA